MTKCKKVKKKAKSIEINAAKNAKEINKLSDS